MSSFVTEEIVMETDNLNPTSERKAKVLLLDDHQVVLDALLFVLSPQYEVRGVDSLKAFREAVDQFAPNLAVVDVRLADGDGFEVGRRILADHPDLKLMFLSMHTEPRFVKRATEVGAHAYLSKRAPMDELLLAIRTVLNGGKYIGSRVQAMDEEHLSPEGTLTERQLEVLRLISQGCSAKEIASKLNISVRTAEFHRAAIMDRLKLHSTAMMTRYAVERGIS